MIDEKRITEEFARLVAIDAPSYKERAMADALTAKLKALGFEVTEDDAGSHYNSDTGNLYGFLKGTAKGEPVLFSAHMDTVEPALGKRAVIHEDGKITSAGDTVLGSDDVAGLVEILEGVRHLQEEGIPHRDIEVLFPIAEEVFIRGSEVFDFSRVKAKECYVLDLQGAPGIASLQEPTHLSIAITVRGKAAHAGFSPEEGINAIAVAAKAISEIRQGRVDEESTVNIGTIHGGFASNIVSEEVTMQAEVRSYDHEHALHLAEEIRQAFERNAGEAKVSFQIEQHLHAYQTPADHPVVTRFRDACKELGLPGTLTRTLGGSDNNACARHGITGIVLSCGMNLVHSTKEYTSVQELADGAKLVALLAQ